MEFQPVIMAAGRGSRMKDLTNKCCKALLPIGNIPMIMYSINLLEREGFDETIIVVLESSLQDIKKAVIGVHLKIDWVSIPDSNYWGTADSLRFMKDKIKADLLIMSCDFVTDLPLHHFANIHRTYDATVTMLLSPIPTQYIDVQAPGIKSRKTYDRDFIGLDERGDRVLFMTSEADLDETVTFRKSVLKKHPLINIKSGLVDCHTYFMKKWVVDFLVNSPNISQIKGELIPYLVRKQFSKPKPKVEDLQTTNMSIVSEDIKPDIFTFSKDDSMTNQVRDMSSWIDHTGDMADCFHDNKLRCYAYIQESGFCVRANTVSAYCECNKQMPRVLSSVINDKDVKNIHSSTTMKEKSQVGADCLVAEGALIGEKTSIKRSIIGKHCQIGDKVKITNSVIMDYVRVLEGSNIQGSLICANALVNEKCEVKDCIIGNGQSIMAMGKHTNEEIVEVDDGMEI